MSIDRYLATHYPIFHRTSVTKGKLLTIFACLVITVTTVRVMSISNLVIPFQIGTLIIDIICIPPILFINYKLLTVARKSHRNTELKKAFSLKSISSCLLVVACLIFLCIPTLVYVVQRQTSKGTKFTLDNAHLAQLWAGTATSMNSTFNCF